LMGDGASYDRRRHVTPNTTASGPARLSQRMTDNREPHETA
jgi:hypothetical protein